MVMEARGCARQWTVFHDTYTFALMGDARAGHVDWRYRQRSFVVGGDKMVMAVQPGELHATTKRTPAWDFIVVMAREALVHSVAHDLGWPHAQLNLRREEADSSHPAMIRALSMLRSSLCTTLFEPEDQCTCRLSAGPILEALGEVVAVFIEHYAERAQQVMLVSSKGSPLRRAKDFLHQHYRDPYDLDRLAAAAGCSKFYLARLFKKEFGVSPSQYRARVLVSKSCELLTSYPDRSLEWIAAEMGWRRRVRDLPDTTVMSRTFKRVLGVTPDRFRSPLRLVQPRKAWATVGELWHSETRSLFLERRHQRRHDASSSARRSVQRS
jgi:AraC-like DNA-binding protein